MHKLISPHEQLLVELGESFRAIGRELRLRHDHKFTCVTPVLDQVVIIIGAQATANVKQIAALLAITSGAATQHIDALEKQGTVSRIINQQDRREIIVRLTGAGEKLYQQIHRNRLQLLETVFNGLEEKELQTLVNLVAKASENVAKGAKT